MDWGEPEAHRIFAQDDRIGAFSALYLESMTVSNACGGVAAGAGLWPAAAHVPSLESQPDSLPSYSQELPDMLLSYLARKTNSLAAEPTRSLLSSIESQPNAVIP